MADRYWVGGNGTWDATTTHWSATSGGAAGASVPTSADNVIFNSAAWGFSYIVTIGTASTCLDISISGPATGTVTVTYLATPSVLNVHGSWLNAATGVAFSSAAGSILNFLATSSGKTFTTNNVTLLGLTVRFNGVNGYWTLGSNLTITGGGSPNILAGTFDTGGFAMTLNSFSSTTTTNARTIKLNASAIICSGTTPVNLAATNLTFNAGISTINCSNGSMTFAGGGQTFYNVLFSSTAASIGSVAVTGENAFFDLNVSTNALQKIITLSANQTINGTLTLGATNTASTRMSVVSDIVGTQRFLTVSNLATLADVDFRNVSAAGASAPWSGTRLGDCLSNSGIYFDAPKTVYWNRPVGGIWTDTAWALTSGGAVAVNNFPLPQDTVFIEDTGLNLSATININTNTDIGSLDMSMRGLDMTLNLGNTDPKFYGNVNTVPAGIIITGATSPTFSFLGQGLNNTLNAGFLGLNNLIVNCPNGSLTLQTSTTVQLTASSGTVTLTAGTFNLDGNNLTAVAFSSTSATGTVRTLTQSYGTINVTGNSLTVWNTLLATGLTYTTPPVVNSTYSGSIGTRTFSVGPTVESNAVSINVTAGSGGVLLTTVGGVYGSMNFTGYTGTLNFSSTVAIYGSFNSGNAVSISGAPGTCNFVGASATKTIQLNGLSFPAAVSFNGVGAVWNCIGALNVVGDCSITNGTLNLAAGTTSTVGSFTIFGTTAKSLGSTTPGTQATISDASGTDTVTYLTIKDSAATGGAVWDATSGTNSNSGNNTGWIFGIDVIALVTGVEATGYIGTPTVFSDVIVYPSGVVGYGQIGTALVWGLVNNTQTPNWQQIVS